MICVRSGRGMTQSAVLGDLVAIALSSSIDFVAVALCVLKTWAVVP